MKKSIYLFLAFLTLGIFLGFSNSDDPKGLTKANFVNKTKSTPIVIDNNNNNPISTGHDYYSDDFTGPNDTAALKARGYLVYRNGTFTGSVPPSFWRTGLPPPSFPAFNGADTDYVGSGYQSAGDLGDIDNWLVLPALDVVAIDSICFYSRSVEGVSWPDSIRVMFNPFGGTLPGSPGWIELGRFEVNRVGIWELRSFVIPSSALGARLAIRYSVVDGGANGANSFWIGIDALRVQGQGVVSGINQISELVPDGYNLSQNYPNPFNPVTKIKFDILSNVKSQMSDVKLTIFNTLGKEVSVLVNEHLSSGSYEVDFEGSNFSSGVYFYKLAIDGNVIDTKRMVLLK